MQSSFGAALAFVLRQEGGYSDNPADPGGATNLGITRRTLAGWRKVSPWWNLPKTAVQALSAAEAGEIYRALYWSPVAGDDLPAGLDLAVFDFAVNSGPDRAARALQGIVGVAVDGRIGPKTLAAVGQRPVATVVTALCASRLGFLGRLSTAAVFGRGWSRRVAAVRAAALAMCGAPEPTPSQPEKGTTPMPLNVLAGYKTYIVGAFMLAIGVAQLLGVSIPDFSGQSAGDLLMQGFAIIFLRQGIANTVAKS